MDGQQPNAEVGLADAAAGIDARAKRETEVAAARRLHQPRRLRERVQPDILARRHDLEALGDERAVERLQPGDVGDRAKGDEVEQVDELRLLPVGEESRAPRSSRISATPSRKAIPTAARWPWVAPSSPSSRRFGIDHRERDRQRRRALVMVDDDDVETGGLRLLERFERLGAAIDRDREARAALLELDQRRARRAVALHQPVGDVDHRLGAEPAQQQDEQGRAGRAIDVIIAENRDRLAGLDRVGEPLGALVHVLEAGRIGQEIADRRLAVTLEVVATNAAGEQELVDQRIHRQVQARPSGAISMAARRPSVSTPSANVMRPKPSRRSRNLRASPLGIAGMEWPVRPPPATPN